MSSETIALMDGDIFAYEIAAAAEEPVNWGDGLWTLHSFEEPAEARLLERIDSLAEKANADRIIVALSDSDNWRNDVLPSYKENRVGKRKPILLKHLKALLEDSYETFIRPSLEADDVLGILATWPKLKGEKVIVTKDKDLQTIPGLHLKTNDLETGVFDVDPDTADYWHLVQTLTGDVTDGYRGCPGIGIKRAEKMLQEVAPEERWDVVLSAFEKAKLSEEEALVQARVARICRASDYDFNRKRVKLWTP